MALSAYDASDLDALLGHEASSSSTPQHAYVDPSLPPLPAQDYTLNVIVKLREVEFAYLLPLDGPPSPPMNTERALDNLSHMIAHDAGSPSAHESKSPTSPRNWLPTRRIASMSTAPPAK